MHVQYSFIFIKSNLLFCQIWKQNSKTSNSGLILALSKGTIFAKTADFYKKNADSSKT